MATLKGGLAHDVSILLGIGRHLLIGNILVRPPALHQASRQWRVM
jgi:hypothetical protein